MAQYARTDPTVNTTCEPGAVAGFTAPVGARKSLFANFFSCLFYMSLGLVLTLLFSQARPLSALLRRCAFASDATPHTSSVSIPSAQS